MAVTLNQSDADFEERFAALLTTKRETSPDVQSAVSAIIADVRARGDEALADYTLNFDGADLRSLGIAVSKAEIA